MRYVSTSRSQPIRTQRYVFVADGTDNMVWILNRQTVSLGLVCGTAATPACSMDDAIVVDSKGTCTP